MSLHSRVLRRLSVAVLGALAVLPVTAGPAAAHVEATVSDGARAGGDPVTVTFSAEAERASAGITGVRVQLPEGILPEWVSLVSGPPGWTLALTGDGYTVTGPELAAGTAAEYAIRIGTLPPDQTTLVFKTLVDYSDGSEDAWIEDTTAENPDPASPAPVVTVAPAAATSAAATSSAAPTPADPTNAQATDTDTAASGSSGSSTALVLTVALAVVIVLGAALWFWRSRAARGSG